jgi:hypothetical protein
MKKNKKINVERIERTEFINRSKSDFIKKDIIHKKKYRIKSKLKCPIWDDIKIRRGRNKPLIVKLQKNKI